MKEKLVFTIYNPLFWFFKKINRWKKKHHTCIYWKNLYDIPMENNTNFLISQCDCGKTDIKRVHRESEAYKNLLLQGGFQLTK